TLFAMLNEDKLPGSIQAEELCRAVARIAQRSAPLQADLGVPLTDVPALRRHLEDNPIKAWTGGAGTGDIGYFTWENGLFTSRFDIPMDQRAGFQSLIRELVEWRLAEYLARASAAEAPQDDRIVCKVSHSGGRPILFLPDRANHPSIPTGTIPIMIDTEAYEADFVKVAVNVIRKRGSDRNEIPGLERGWFGHDAGLPGTNFSVAFEH